MPKQTLSDCDSAQAAGRHGQAGAWRLPFLGAACLMVALAGGRTEAAGNDALGRYLSTECTGCQQFSGKSVGGIPSIIGWPEDQFFAVLAAYGRKERGGQVMQAIAAKLGPEEMAALAAYLGRLAPKP